MYKDTIVCDINYDGIIRYKQNGEFVQVGVASTPSDSKLIKAVDYEEYAPDGLQTLINHALLNRCMPDRLFEFNVHYN